MTRKFILNGHEPVEVHDLEEWARWYQGADDVRRVARTAVADVDVSTVFLALDHAFYGGEPVLFETMVFGGTLDGEQERYHTWADAEAGHATMVARVTEATP